MTAPRDPDMIVAAWLDEGPEGLPESTKRAIAVATRTNDQSRRPNWVLWRFPNVNGTVRFALAAAAVVAVALGGFYVLNRGQNAPGNAGGQPTPTPVLSDSPVPSPTIALLDTSSWVGYTSERYGFSIRHPVGWTEVSADHDWTLEADAADWLSTAQEVFFTSVGEGVRVSAWSVPIDPEASLSGWRTAYCATCNWLPIGDDPVEIDGNPVTLILGEADTQAVTRVDDRIYVVAVWWGDSDPAAASYGGARRLLESFLSTMHMLPGGAATETTAPS